MNNKVGLQNLFDHKEALTLLARFVAQKKNMKRYIFFLLRSVTPTVPLVMLEAMKLMAALCLVPPDGHKKVSFEKKFGIHIAERVKTNTQQKLRSPSCTFKRKNS